MIKTRQKKSTSLLLTLAGLFMLVLVVSVSAQVQTAGSNGNPKTVFSSDENVFVRSGAGLCNSVYENVSVYVVESGETNLNDDVRNQGQEIALTSSFSISRTLLWDNPTPGIYDVLVDCDQDNNYNALEPKGTFTVNAEKGTANVTLGSATPADHTFKFNPDNSQEKNEMIQLLLTGRGEDIELTDLVVTFHTPDAGIPLNTLEVYDDENGNGEIDSGEEVIGEYEPEAPVKDGSRSTILLDFELDKDEPANLLLALHFLESSVSGDIQLTVSSLRGTGVNSAKDIVFLGLPLDSAVKTMLAGEACAGAMRLDITPNPAVKGTSVTAKATNLQGCENKRISFRETSCVVASAATKEIGSCISDSNGCEATFTVENTKSYHACVDKNGDGDVRDAGESATKTVVVKTEVVVKDRTTADDDEDETDGEDDEDTGSRNDRDENDNERNDNEEESSRVEITGAATAIEALTGISGVTGVFLVLLEVTLFLIFLILVMIFFRLKGVQPVMEGSEGTSEASEEKSNDDSESKEDSGDDEEEKPAEEKEKKPTKSRAKKS